MIFLSVIYKEVEFEKPLYSALLDNGVAILVFDGYAKGSDGKIYHCVLEENDEEDAILVGWSCDEE